MQRLPASKPFLHRHSLLGVCALVTILGGGVNLAAAAASPTVLDGVFTQQQADRGKREYDKYCKECHLSDLQGAALEPPLVTSWFIDAWREDYLWSLYDFIHTRMPKSKKYRPGTLKPQETLDIVAYVLAFNEFPTGSAPLTEADLTRVLLVDHDGPKALPSNAMVRTVGCLAASDGYFLMQAAQPARVRTGDETDAVEIERSASQALGGASLALNNLDVVLTADKLSSLTGRKVQAKGVLNALGQADARLFVLSMEDLGACD
jgi:mono/diheme cytochrome c family protein